MKLRKIAALLLALLMMLTLAACAGEKENFTAERLTVWIWDENQLETWQSIADQWTEENRITVDIQVKNKSTYWEEVQRGILPDILWMDTRHLQSCVQGEMLLRLDDLIKSNKLDMEKYYAQVAEGYQIDDYTYGIPMDSSVMALWYNKALFDSVNLTYPDETWTWEQLAEAAEKLTNRHGGKYGIAIDMNDMANGWYNLVYAYGGSILRAGEDGSITSGWNDEAAVKAMNLLADLIYNCMPSQPTMEVLEGYELFASGNVAMLIQSSEDAMALIRESDAVNWACTMLPYVDKDGSGDCGQAERVSMLDGNGWVISSKTSDSAAAFDLLKAFCSEESQKQLASGSLSQPAISGLAQEWCTAIEGWDFTPYIKTLDSAELVTPPIQAAAESWEDYALENTLYIAWNDPARMDEMLQKQHEYTLSDLARGNGGQLESDLPEGETAAEGQTAPEAEDSAAEES